MFLIFYIKESLSHRIESIQIGTRLVGLGLSICKRLIGIMGGRLWIENPVDSEGGSRFCFSLPKLQEKNNQDPEVS